MATATKKKKRKEEAYPWKASASSGHATKLKQSILRLSISMVVTDSEKTAKAGVSAMSRRRREDERAHKRGKCWPFFAELVLFTDLEGEEGGEREYPEDGIKPISNLAREPRP
jgi:hypothetical protein